jgi:hypothetical protein
MNFRFLNKCLKIIIQFQYIWTISVIHNVNYFSFHSVTFHSHQNCVTHLNGQTSNTRQNKLKGYYSSLVTRIRKLAYSRTTVTIEVSFLTSSGLCPLL